MLGGLGAALIQASAPSTVPRSGLDALGAGLAGALQADNASEDKYLKRAMTGAQLAMAQQKVKQLKDWQNLFSGGDASATPSTGVAPDPSAAGAPTPLQPGVATGPNPNNIGNVRPTGASTGFQQPPDFNSGVQLAVNNVQSYPKAFNNGQPMTLLQIGERWAPKGDGQNDPAQWAKNVSAHSGLPVDQPLDLAKPQVQAAFARGVHGAEWGVNSLRPVSDYQTALTAPPSAMPQGGATPVQYTPPAAQAPKTFAQVVQSMPPAVRQMVGVMGPEKGLPLLMKYADSETVPAFDPRTNQMVFVPKTALGTGQYQPVDAANFGLAQRREARESANAKILPNGQLNEALLGYEKKAEQNKLDLEKVPVIDQATGNVVYVPKSALGNGNRPIEGDKLEMDRNRLLMEQLRTNNTLINSKVVNGADGVPQPNAPLLEYDRSVSAAQGTNPEGKMLVGDYDDARKANTELQSGALIARTGIAQTKRLGQLLDQVNTGRFTSTTQEIKQMAKGLGVNLEALGIKDDTAPAQAAQALTGQMALALRNPAGGAGMPGALSDADRQFLTRMVPGLETTPEGRKLMSDYALKMYQRQIDLSKIANDFMRSPEAKKDPNALYQKLQDYAEKNPLFSEKDIPQAPAPANKPGSLALPSMPGQGGGIPAPPSGFKVIGR